MPRWATASSSTWVPVTFARKNSSGWSTDTPAYFRPARWTTPVISRWSSALRHRVGVLDRAVDEVDALRHVAAVAGREVVEHHHVGARLAERQGDVGTDVSGSAGE